MTEAHKSGENAASSLSPLKQALLALDRAQARVRELENAQKEPIAVVGMGCRIPGDEDGVEGYWRLLKEQRCAVSDGVEKRLLDSLQGKTLSQEARRAALLERVDLFDPRHFGISPREAVTMDPQQRLLLEVSWEALENAGIDPFALYQSATGVYLGISSHDYAQLQSWVGDTDAINPHFASGVAPSVAAGRISYVLGLNGPSLSIDTACSSSLVAVHLGCEALLRGDCTTALAGGVNLILSPESSIAFAQAGMLSGSGKVRAFDGGADGFVRGEGCGVVVLKRLGEAKAAGDRIQGLILGSAVNQDGASSGLTVPNGLAQQGLLREAHRRAGIEPWQVGYVEAHGTGTTLGDPIEAEALGVVFGEGKARKEKLWIGSVKTNVGHLESAAGVAGLIKVVLGLQRGKVAGQLNWERPSEHVRWDELPLEVVTEEREWEPIEGRRIGGVSSFGFSGTNAHVVVEGWGEEAREEEREAEEEVLVVTARTEGALRELAERYARFLTESELRWSEICYTAAVGRGVFGERLAVVARGKAEAGEKLRGWLRGESVKGVYRGHVGGGRRAGAAVLGKGAAAGEVAEQFVRGEKEIAWVERAEGRKLRRVSLPTYAFQRERYWIEGVERGEAERGEATGRGVLGRRVRVAGVSGQYEARLSGESWIGEHVVGGRVVLPATGHLELMLEAGGEVIGSRGVLEEVVLQAPLVIEGERRVQTVVEEGAGGRSRVRVYGERKDAGWDLVSEGWLLRGVETEEKAERLDVEGIRERLEGGEGKEGFYAGMRARGLSFGERFRGVEKVWRGAGEALGEIVRKEAGGEGWELEPWWLDACLQVAGAAVKGEEDGELYLPLSIGRVEVYAPAKERSWSHVTTQRVDDSNLSAEVAIADSEGSLLVRFSNLRFRKIANQSAKIASWLYRLEWQKTKSIGDELESTVQDATAELEVRVQQFGSTEALSEYNAFFDELEKLSAAYVLEAIRQLGWPEAGSALSAVTLEDRWKIVPRHRRLFNRLLEIAAETGAVAREADHFRFMAPPSPMDADAGAKILQRFLFGKTELDLVARCGASLVEVLTGKVEGRELVFPGARSEEVGRLYRDSVPARIYNEMLAEMVSRIVKVRGGAATRILEVGGGTASTTQYVLEALRVAGVVPGEYVFTDISPLLVRRAQQSFQEASFFHTNVFDLEREGRAQGIYGPFSIVLAVNVLHATADLSATLGRLKPLLAADGVLILVEVVGKQRWADITVGLLDEWWSFADRHVRPDYPTLERGAWQPLLERAGFRQIVTIPQRAEQGSIFRRQEMIIAGAPARPKRMWVVGEGELADKIALRLRRQSVLVDCIHFGEVTGRHASQVSVDAVLWVAPQDKSFENVSVASTVAESPVRSLLATAQALLPHRAQTSPRLYVVTSGAFVVGTAGVEIRLADTPLAGLAAGIAAETPELRCTRLDCSAEDNDSNAAGIATEVLSNADNRCVAWRSSERYVARLQRVRATQEETPERVQLKTGPGIEALEYIPDTRREIQPDEVEINVHATGLNFHDVLQSLGIMPPDAPIGTDCAGVILRVGEAITDLVPGDEVVAIASGCFASHVIAHRALVVRMPEGLSFAEATAQATAYLTADFCLNERARIRKGERVLIHAAAGGVGLAAVHLCQKMGAEPIATAGAERKRDFLRSLGVSQVYDSRSLEFAKQIVSGVDIVLNSLTGGAIDASLKLLKPRGRFIELGRTDLRDPKSVERTWPGIRYLPVDLTPLFGARSSWVAERLAGLLKEIAEGSLPLLPTTVFDSTDIKEAFRSMARAAQIGRIVVQRKGLDRFSGTHLVTGGMRGIGLNLAAWLAQHGARRLVLIGRREPGEAEQQTIARLRAQGVTVLIMRGDIADPGVAEDAVRLAGKDLRGVWHSAGVLENAPLAEQSWDRIHSVLRPKMDGAWNLHMQTRAMPIEQFVLFSSWASIAGSYGQVNHCAANAFLDGLAHFRRTQGLPALSVNWGAWGETGAASGDEVRRQLARFGIQSMPPEDALDAMHVALKSNHSQVAIAAIDWPRYLNQRLRQTDSSLYAEVLHEDLAQSEKRILVGRSTPAERTETKLAASSLKASIVESLLALPTGLREGALLRTIGDIVRKTLDLHIDEEIDPDLPLSYLGMDSLLAIELQSSLSVVLQRKLSSTILFDYPTLRTLVRYLQGEVLSITPEAPDAETKIPVRTIAIGSENTLGILDAIEQLSDEEVESLYEGDLRP